MKFRLGQACTRREKESEHEIKRREKREEREKAFLILGLSRVDYHMANFDRGPKTRLRESPL